MHLTTRMMRANLSEENNVVGEISVDHPALSLKTDLQKMTITLMMMMVVGLVSVTLIPPLFCSMGKSGKRMAMVMR